ncbi:Twin-arginine translocation pathway signal [Flavobacterium limnosediminis JC2902]|uniref:Twin-arginine translocation pathway signal n=1 Tax=Flavobacterium limnosediminis JC2902 TaxID=1341181 RepID=V6SIP3_9FLAO|nr:alkaline phosphatase PhoX [Flavobacterium limnosediminis]ESU26309.1 Twin-arginine translocation pathway signal [Flavobacterium limnosediminis JC2902]
MKKSLLFLFGLFSLWSFALINFEGVHSFPIVETEEKEQPSIEKKKETKNKVKVKKNTVTTVLPVAQYPLQKGSQWSYLDNGSDQGATGWNLTTFDNSAWAAGAAPLGYGDPMSTVISYGPSSSNKYITYYFSRDIQIDLNAIGDVVEFGLRRDDGAIVYINGVEVFRDNMPAGAVTYLTNSSAIIDGADEKRYFARYLPKTVFQNGVNRIAVEIHNRDQTSSDISFDMYIRDKAADYVCEEDHIACFTSIAPTSQTPVMIIPQEHRFQMLFKQGGSYMDGSGTIPGNHDFTGYIPSAGVTSSSLGHLSINHENNPGGVSILDIQLNQDLVNPLWTVNNSRKVDFSNSALVKTERNCSGGITPWGTIITAEESTTSGDANGDGYQDVGWLVEINPVTAAVVNYGNASHEKLWALGRMNHENIVVSADGTTAYYGEDGGTHCMYKFVANTPNNLSSGSVYVLKMDLALSNDEPSSATATWVQVPNTTQAERNNLTAAAAALGGTNFNGVEDCEISPIDGRIYFTSKGKNRVYRFKDNGTTITEFETFVGGKSYPITTANGVVTENWADGNDNLAFDNHGNLWVIQDGGLNYIWVVRPNHTQSDPKVLIHSSMPAGSEPTGLTFTPDYKYGFFSVQHPSGSNQAQQDATRGNVTFNASAALVFSNKDFLGEQQNLSTNPVTELSNEMRVYPNPTKGLVTLSLNEEAGKNVKIEVFDFLGRKVYAKDELTTGINQEITVDLSEFKGEQLFVIQVQAGDKKQVCKVVKTDN